MCVDTKGDWEDDEGRYPPDVIPPLKTSEVEGEEERDVFSPILPLPPPAVACEEEIEVEEGTAEGVGGGRMEWV